ncbi:MAG: nucleoside-diphosphate kinase, partial [Candidatus Marinimicrobia bacterium]|nr:nucleoside-diphosphate kinase [Candidatus Neomarinimicrobiota bacterium]
MGNKTFAIIKPDAVKNGYTGKIYDRILQADFKILSAKLMKMTKAQAEGFYEVHKERPFYEELTTFMSSGPCMVLALEKDNAVSAWRETIGATNPDEA